ncbi:MAG TPA: hypothetical protein VFU73_06070 [Actinocrinis sp.]|nr:hypothetical protein [Actinocrinis sp.]
MTVVLVAVLTVSLLSLVLAARTIRALAELLERQTAGADETSLPDAPIFSSHRAGSPTSRGHRFRTPAGPLDSGVRGGAWHGGAGREVHISRRVNWWEVDGGQISAAEFKAAVAADADLAMVTVPDIWRWEPRCIAEMATAAGPEPRENLVWRAGRIVARRPSPALIAKMCELARTLGARVQGDDGEYYDT